MAAATARLQHEMIEHEPRQASEPRAIQTFNDRGRWCRTCETASASSSLARERFCTLASLAASRSFFSSRSSLTLRTSAGVSATVGNCARQPIELRFGLDKLRGNGLANLASRQLGVLARRKLQEFVQTQRFKMLQQ